MAADILKLERDDPLALGQHHPRQRNHAPCRAWPRDHRKGFLLN